MALLYQGNLAYLPGMELERAACEEMKLEDSYPSLGTWQVPVS